MGGKPRKPAPPPFEPVEQALKEMPMPSLVFSHAQQFAKRVAELTLLEAAKMAEDDKGYYSPYDYGHDGVRAIEHALYTTAGKMRDKAKELK